MSGWGQHIDELAAATAGLLLEGPSALHLEDPASTLAARDIMLTEVRELVGSVSEAPRFNEVRPLTASDIIERPGQSLHQALSELPRAVSFGSSELH